MRDLDKLRKKKQNNHSTIHTQHQVLLHTQQQLLKNTLEERKVFRIHQRTDISGHLTEG